MALPSGRILRFGGLQVVNAIAPVLVLPAVISAVGTAGWVGFSIGYGVGAAASVGVNFAWPITGPALVAGQPVSVAQEVFRRALLMRVLVSGPVLVVGAISAVVLSPPGHRTLSVLMMAATAVNGLAANWYFIGRGQAGGIVLYETVPKLVATGLSIPLIHVTGVAITYPMLLLFVGLGGALVSSWRITGDVIPRPPGEGNALLALRRQAPLAGAGLVSSMATALAVPIAALVSPSVGALAVFAAATRLRTLAQAGVGALATGVQGWVSEAPDPESIKHRGKLCLKACMAMGGLTVLLLAIGTPIVDTLIFGPDIEMDLALALVIGLTCLMYATSVSLTSHVLAPHGETKSIVSATMIASLVAAPVILIGMHLGEALGAMVGVLLAEVIVVTIQAYAARSRVWGSSTR